MWTEKDLEDFAKKHLSKSKLVIVSNREPFQHDFKEGKIQCVKPAGGLVTALDPIMRACGGTWVAFASGNADLRTADKNGRLRVPPENPKYNLRRVWLTKEEVEGYYYGFSNEVLWPLCHVVYRRPVVREEDWATYTAVNHKFAQVVLEEIGSEDAIVFIQDYHLALLPRFLREKRSDLPLIQFWHIPWPNPEVFRTCPQAKEILEGLLANDILGFHIRYYCNNFLNTVNQTFEARVDRERTSAHLGGHETLVRSFAISVDFERISRLSSSSMVEEKMKQLRAEYNLDTEFVLGGLDRIDYTKGIPERILAFDRFLETYPQYRTRVTLFQVGELSRLHIQAYKDLNDEINALIERVNWKHSTDTWQPVVLIRRHLSYEEMLALFRLSHALLVTSLHDGMNLVVKEFVASRSDGKGVAILSRFTGASRELDTALLVNPYGREETAEAIHQALEMTDEEQRRRMSRMRSLVRENNIYYWAGKILNELPRIARDVTNGPTLSPVWLEETAKRA